MSRRRGDGFHVVRKSHNDVIQGYEVWCNNQPFIRGAGQPLRMREARWVAEKLNQETGMRFVDESKVA